MVFLHGCRKLRRAAPKVQHAGASVYECTVYLTLLARAILDSPLLLSLTRPLCYTLSSHSGCMPYYLC